MPRLLTDEQVEYLAREFACDLVERVSELVPGAFDDIQARHHREAVEHELTDFLEGLPKPDEGEWS